MSDTELLSKDAKTWAMLSHLGTFSGFVIPFGNIIVPLVIWLSKKQESNFVADQAKEVLNFQISVIVYFIVGFILILFSIFRDMGSHLFNSIFLVVLLGVLWLFDLIITIVGAIKANDGIRFRYPLNLRFIR